MRRNMRTAAFVLGTLLALPAVGHASTEARMHEVKGVVRFMDPTKLVITRMPEYGERRMSFILSPSTEREGRVRVGSTVEVRYRTDADQRIATDIIVEHAQMPPSTSGSHQ